MTRWILALTISILILTVSCGCSWGANTWPFPNAKSGVANGIGDSYMSIPMYQGWYEGQVAWHVYAALYHIYYDANWAQMPNVDLDYRVRYTRLTGTIGKGANLMYVVLNYNQGPVFSTRPGNDDYSGLWQVVYIKWKPGVARRPIISHLNLPLPTEADITPTNIVVDRPIVAIGRLGGPWLPAPPGTYRIKQARGYDPYGKRISLPVWFVYSQEYVGKQPQVSVLLITDVADEDLATLLKANVAPGLNLVDVEDTQPFWVQDWTLPPAVPPFQLPVIVQCDFLHVFGSDVRIGHNFNFTPVMDFIPLERKTLPQYVVVNNPTLMWRLIVEGRFEPVSEPMRINAPVLVSVDLREIFR